MDTTTKEEVTSLTHLHNVHFCPGNHASARRGGSRRYMSPFLADRVGQSNGKIVAGSNLDPQASARQSLLRRFRTPHNCFVTDIKNPTDWKHFDSLTPPNCLLGCDYSGIIASVGEDVKGLKVGDKVSSQVHGGKFPDRGSYAEYLKVEQEMLWKVPEGLEMDEAATFGVGYCTAGLVSFDRKSIDR